MLTSSKLIERLERVTTLLGFLRRTWPLDEPLHNGLVELEGELSEATVEARYLGALLDEAAAAVRGFEAAAEALDESSEIDAWVVHVADRLKAEAPGGGS